MQIEVKFKTTKGEEILSIKVSPPFYIYTEDEGHHSINKLITDAITDFVKVNNLELLPHPIVYIRLSPIVFYS